MYREGQPVKGERRDSKRAADKARMPKHGAGLRNVQRIQAARAEEQKGGQK